MLRRGIQPRERDRHRFLRLGEVRAEWNLTLFQSASHRGYIALSSPSDRRQRRGIAEGAVPRLKPWWLP